MNVAFVTPIEVAPHGTDFPSRTALWRQSLAALGSLTTIVIDVASESVRTDLPSTSNDELGDIVTIASFELAHDTHPERTRRAPEYLGARWSHQLPTFDLIVGWSPDLGPFCFGLASTGDIPVVLDLVPDVAMTDADGSDEDVRYQLLTAQVRKRCDLVVNSSYSNGEFRIPDIERVESLLRPPAGPVRLRGTIPTETAQGLIVGAPLDGFDHHLDPVAAIVYSLADGATSADDIIDVLTTALATTSDTALRRFYIALDQLIDARLVNDGPGFERTELPQSQRRFRVRKHSIDHFVVHHVYSGDEYDIPTELPTGTVVIDIGAHVGSFSARMIDSGADYVVALEPQPDNFHLAMMNLAVEVERGVVDLRQSAIWSPPANQRISIGVAPEYPEPGQPPSLNTGAHRPRVVTDSTAPLEPGEYVVASQTLDGLITELRDRHAFPAPIWLKLDCEGGEWPVLETADRLDQIDTIVGEMHLDADSPPARRDRVVERLQSFGFTVTLSEDADAPAELRFRAERR